MHDCVAVCCFPSRGINWDNFQNDLKDAFAFFLLRWKPHISYICEEVFRFLISGDSRYKSKVVRLLHFGSL